MEHNGSPQARPRRHLLRRVLVVVGSLTVLGYLLFPPVAPLDKANLVGYAICHQIPARSFHMAGHRLPLCARCTGTYLGVAIGFAALAVLGRWRAAEMPQKWLVIVLVCFIAIMGIDGLNSYLDLVVDRSLLYEPQNWLRAASGSLNGIALSLIVMPVFNYTLWKDPKRERSIQSVWELLGIVAVVAITVGAVQAEPAWLLYPIALLTAAGVLWMLTLVNTMIMVIILQRDSQAETWRDAAAALLMGLTTALVELTVMGTFRYLATGTTAWPLAV